MMPTPEKNELLDYIQQLIELTRDGSGEWVKANPTTFTWETVTPTPATLSLQRVNRPKLEAIYFFQVIDTSRLRAVVFVDGGNDPDANQRLGELFQAIETSIVRKGLDFLKSHFPTKKA